MACEWCEGPIPGDARRDSVFCGQKCRQRAWRARERFAELAARPARRARPLRMAYADPPFPGLSRRYYQGEASYAGEVDHVALLAELQGFDGWALSTGAYALRDLLPLCPDGAKVCPWVKPRRRNARAYGVHNAWEPLIVVPGRRLRPGPCDWLEAAPARLGGSSLPGRKPPRFVAWLFACLGLLPGDELVDLFPGSGIVGRAWREVQRRAVPQVPAATGRADVVVDASPNAGARRVGRAQTATRRQDQVRDVSRRDEQPRDASRVGRRRRVPLGLVAE